jgi:transposase InsO family protein
LRRGPTIIGGISDDRRAGFRTYVVQEKRSSYRDELLNGEIFYTLEEAKVIIESWRRHYNTVRPHSSLGYRPPAPEVFIPAQPASQPGPPTPAALTLVPRPNLN